MPAVFRFGDFEVRPDAGELRKRGIRIKLHTQPFEILRALIERPSEIVTREELRARLWPDGTFVDFDHGLNTAVNKLRDALGDSASAPRYIETVAGKGYRFLVPVDAPAPEIQTSAAILTTRAELPPAPRRRILILLLLLQAMYAAFYVGALGNLAEIHDIFLETGLPPGLMMGLVVGTAALLIPVRLFISTALLFDFPHFEEKFRKLFPPLLVLDLLWALSPFLLIHHISFGIALALCAPLIYVPFAQRSLVLMFTRFNNS